MQRLCGADAVNLHCNIGSCDFLFACILGYRLSTFIDLLSSMYKMSDRTVCWDLQAVMSF